MSNQENRELWAFMATAMIATDGVVMGGSSFLLDSNLVGRLLISGRFASTCIIDLHQGRMARGRQTYGGVNPMEQADGSFRIFQESK